MGKGQNWLGGLEIQARVIELGLGNVGDIFRQKPAI